VFLGCVDFRWKRFYCWTGFIMYNRIHSRFLGLQHIFFGQRNSIILPLRIGCIVLVVLRSEASVWRKFFTLRYRVVPAIGVLAEMDEVVHFNIFNLHTSRFGFTHSAINECIQLLTSSSNCSCMHDYRFSLATNKEGELMRLNKAAGY
jgi:hypothetical protein